METINTLQYDENNQPYIDFGTTRLFSEKMEPPEWALEKARNELRELPEITEPAIKKLRELIQNEEYFEVPTDDAFLTLVLRSCKYYPESAFKRLQNLYQMKLKHTDIFQDLLPSNLRNVFENEIFHLIPNRDQHGRRIFILEAGKKWNPSRVPLNDLIRATMLAAIAGMLEPTTQICGVVAIFDLDSMPISHIMHFSPFIAQLLLYYVQDCATFRIKEVHIVNNSYIFNMVFAIFKPFFREKLRKRIFFHGRNMKSLVSYIDPAVLPPKYGGTFEAEFPPGKVLYEFLECQNDDFKEFNNYGYQEGYKMKK